MKSTTENNPLTRRSFLVGAGALAGIAAAGLAGCTPSGSAGSSAAAGGTFDEEWDIIIVGSGIAGLSAAITVANEGNDEKCLMIEKGRNGANGCSPVCDGWWLGANDGVEYPVQYLKDCATTPIGQSIPDDVLEAFAKGITENTDWVLNLAPELTEDHFETFNGTFEGSPTKAEWREFDNAPTAKTHLNPENEYPNDHIFNVLNNYFENSCTEAVTRRNNMPLESLIVDPEGAVVGLIADGKRYKANKAVIMACGGYENNPEWMEGYCGVGASKTRCMGSNTGDGHKAVMKVGADLWHMHNCAGFAMAPRDLKNEKWANIIGFEEQKQYGITVAKNGRRFYMDWDGIDINRDEENDEWSMGRLDLHVGARHGLMQFGGEWNHLPMPSIAWFVFDQDGYENGAFDFEYTNCDDPVGDGWLYMADTIEELADLCGVPADQLSKTVNTWNEFCDGGEDLAFFRPKSTLNKVAKAPFYAQLCNPQHLNTDGGPVRNANGQIMSVNGEPIPGLYAAGEFGSVWGHHYQGCGNVAEAMAFGRIAACSVIAL